ncbi:Meiotic Sister-Chromatid recombination aldehyde dehydrogenase [Aspergillus nanangensis]|uniref:aldehyde dehydrogenase (NAD(+)) n=1 Tax=Aspergillus nanangensis TaxID=2582783 RepID=A0AAD4CT74_ASPNN|nr:Meiotic Sister-Chromatid recombination aldehyde dehydrogenase [Aspergillus nanangensis]
MGPRITRSATRQAASLLAPKEAPEPPAKRQRTTPTSTSSISASKLEELPHNLGSSISTTNFTSNSSIDKQTTPIKRNPPLKSEDHEGEKEETTNSILTTHPQNTAPKSTERTPKSKSKSKSSKYGLTPGTTPFPNWPSPTATECEEVNKLLSSVHGEITAPTTIPEPSLTVTGCGEVPSVLDALIRTLLSGATTGSNSARAFSGLVQRFGILQEGIGKGSVNWDAVRQAPLKEVFEAIKSGGLADIKSKNLKSILDMVYQENQDRRDTIIKADDSNNNDTDIKHESEGRKQYDLACAEEHFLSLNHLHSLPTQDAMAHLLRYPGIGPKTAACVVLFCLQRPCFAVDTHIFRICKWLGWVPPDQATEITAFSHLEVRIPDHLKYSLHALFIRHGKACPRCRAITGMSSAGWEEGCVIDHLFQQVYFVVLLVLYLSGTCAAEPLLLRVGPLSCFPPINNNFPPQHPIPLRSIQLSAVLNCTVTPPDMDALAAYIPPALYPLVEPLCEYAPVLGVALVSLGAVYLGYLFILCHREAAVSFNVPIPPEVRANATIRKWEDVQGEEKQVLEGQARGQWSDKLIMSYCPADGRVLGSGIKPATPEAVDRAIQAAKTAQVEWSQTTFAERRKVLKTLLKYVLEHQDELATVCCLDSGKTKVDACFGEILVTAEKLKWTIDHGEKALTPESRPTNFLMMYKKNTVTYEPLGVVSAAVSWNYPFHNFIGPVISAIFAGNSIVVKPSEQTAWSSAFFLEVIRGALSSCGHPRDLVQSVVCLPSVADVLTSHRDVAQLTFIGSRPVAHKVCESAAKALIPVTVELGGKDPAVILDDPRTVSEVSSIASVLMRAVFQSAGQNCIGVERVVALPGIYDKLLDLVAPRIQKLRLGSVLLDSTSPAGCPDMGASISATSFDRLEALIADAVKQGARLICGGKRYNHPAHPHGHYFTPTLLADVTPEMRIAQTEVFAPVFVLMRADSVPHAIAIANSTEYALGASVFGYNPAEVAAAVSGIKAGMVSVNDFGTYYAVQLPFGGVKGSGYGRFGGEEGLHGVSNLKALCVDRFPKLVATRIPPRIDYPIRKGEDAKQNGTGAWELCKGVVETGYQLTLRGRIRGILRLLGNM